MGCTIPIFTNRDVNHADSYTAKIEEENLILEQKLAKCLKTYLDAKSSSAPRAMAVTTHPSVYGRQLGIQILLLDQPSSSAEL